MRKIISLILLVLILLVSAGCSEESKIKDTIRQYNKAVSKTYLTGDYMDLRKVAMLDEQKKVGEKLREMRDDGKKLRSDLEKIKFREVKVAENKASAVVTTEEEWAYELLNDTTDVQLSPSKRTFYEVVYSLSKVSMDKKETWLIDNVTIQKEEDL